MSTVTMTSKIVVSRIRRAASVQLNPRLTIDLCVSALSKSVFHPFIACLLPLCLRALAAPYDSISFRLTATFALCVCLGHILALFNQRIAYGSPRTLRWETELVVITGGLNGLGRCIAEIFALKGVSVAVLDIDVSKHQDGAKDEGVHYYRCNIAKLSELQIAHARITKDLGTPTILINNAAVVRAGSLCDVSAEDVESVFQVNTLSHFRLSQIFLRPLIASQKRGTIVTIASVLGSQGAANLSAYCASKGALLSYHQSMTAELAISAPKIKTILVASGQLDTQLFSMIQTQGCLRNFLCPVVSAGELATRIVSMIDAGRSGTIYMPLFSYLSAWLHVLPVSIKKVLLDWTQIHKAVTVQSGAPSHTKIDTYDDSNEDDESETDEEEEPS